MRINVPSFRNTFLAALLAGSFGAFVGCGGAPLEADAQTEFGVDDQQALSDRRVEPITSLTLRNGARVRFFEPEPGRVVVFSDGEVAANLESLAPTKLYETLSGSAAPTVLKDAERRGDEARKSRTPRAENQHADSAPVPPALLRPSANENGLLTVQQGLTSSAFTSAWCSASGPLNFDYCWTNRTNDYSIEIKSVDWIHSHVNAVSGSFVMSLYYKNVWGNWILLASDSISGSSNVTTQSTTSNDTYKVQITQASGDTYHLSIHGEK